MNKIHLIGNAHLDPVWLWRWQEGFSEVLATFRSALDRMKDFDDFKFTSACAVYYEWIERIDPEMFEEIKVLLKKANGILSEAGICSLTAICLTGKALPVTPLFLRDILRISLV